MTTSFFAHSPPGVTFKPPPIGWHALAAHLRAVADLAKRYAQETLVIDPADSEEARRLKQSFHDGAYFAGLLHDLGKYRPEFQLMIRRKLSKSAKTRHKHVGAFHAVDKKRVDIAFAIAGHHGQIPSMMSAAGPTPLKTIWSDSASGVVRDSVWPLACEEIRELAEPIPAWAGGKDRLRFDLFVRLLFSCLVDADWEDTGSFHRLSRGLPLEPPWPVLSPSDHLERVLSYIQSRARRCPETRMAQLRKSILNASLSAASLAPGLFAMSVPTGGGKTLTALAFALAHAAEYSLRRIIYVAPYLSIIEQNARVIRCALGTKNHELIFEHHSLTEAEGPNEDDAELAEEASRRAENWAAPIIVTTSVQFFESLFANTPSACRKLHNLAGSVVILDECQSVPPGLLAPTCAMLGQVAPMIGCSLVLCTATQPAWNRRADFNEGLENVREIVPPELNLFEALRRVRVTWPQSRDERLDWPTVAAIMARETAVLCIVNTRPAALCLAEELDRLDCKQVYHLSTTMCPKHRLKVLDTVRQLLKKGKPCRLVSTQLIEAGCDVDFPMVLREMAPLEAVIQAAGRCNREGRLRSHEGGPGGHVQVFRSIEGKLPLDRWYSAGRDKLEQSLSAGSPPDIGRPGDIEEYYQRLYCTGSLDRHGIQAARAVQDFPSVAQKYRLIEESTLGVVVTTWSGHEDEVTQLLDLLQRTSSRAHYRKLTSYQVNLRSYERLRGQPLLAQGPAGLTLWIGVYDDRFGLRLDGNLGDKCII